jgi:hypothetical protein
MSDSDRYLVLIQQYLEICKHEEVNATAVFKNQQVFISENKIYDIHIET